MSEEHKPATPEEPLNALAQLLRHLQLILRLMLDPRVPILPKLIIPAAILYVVSPIDLLPDFILGLGQVDDVGILFLSLGFFVEMCPPAIVEEHRRALAAEFSRTTAPTEDIVEGTYRVMNDDEPK